MGQALCLAIDEMEMYGINMNGIVIGLGSLILMWIFNQLILNPADNQRERSWILFLSVGVVSIGYSVYTDSYTLSAIAGVFGFATLCRIRRSSAPTDESSE